MSDLLKKVIQGLINEDESSASDALHQYITNKTRQIAGLNEGAQPKFIDLLLDAIEYRDHKDNGFVIDGSQTSEDDTKITFDLEDRYGHRQLAYKGKLSIGTNGKITVSCGDQTKVFKFDQDQDRDDFEQKLDDLALNILDVFKLGVSKMSRDDNPDD